MSAIAGTYTAAPLSPGDTAAKYGTHYSFFGIGGYHEYVTIEERDGMAVDETYARLNEDGMSSGRRRLGMIVFVHNTRKFYQLSILNYFDLATDESKYLALADNAYWKQDPFMIPAVPQTNIVRIPLTYIYASPDQQVEILFKNLNEFDFNGRLSDNIFILDTTGMEAELDAGAHANVTPSVFITVRDSQTGGFVGEAGIGKRINGSMELLSPGDLAANRLYYLLPPADRSMNGTAFVHPWELIKWEGFNFKTPAPFTNMLRIPSGSLYGSADGVTEILFDFGDFDFNGRFIDTIYMLDTSGLTTSIDGQGMNVTTDVRLRILDSNRGGVLGVSPIQKRVNGTLVNLEPGDLKADQLYFLMPPVNHSRAGADFSRPFELVKWDWSVPPPAVDKYYTANLPIGDTEEVQTVYGYNHGLDKIPSVTVMDGTNKVINKDVSITINPVNFDVVVTFAAFPPSGKIVLN